ncbi:Response regulator protein TmoT [Phycisphaerae bacterium RAS1]|nr:Response regulator protein TmoT [Phycisphaerae bacterium RAS1]
MTAIEPTVFVVDDDAAVGEGIRNLLASLEIPVETYPSAQAFLNGYDASRAGCLLLDVRMPGMSGPELQELLAARRIELPIIFITGHGDIPMAVQAIKRGAVDVLEKPFRQEALLERVQQAFARDRQARERRAARVDVSQRMESLTPRERDVLRFLLRGDSADQIAAAMKLSSKTIYVHRGNLLDKLGARSVADLIRMWSVLEPSK